MNLPKAIITKRKELGLSQQFISEKYNFGHNQLSLIESDKVTPTIPTLIRLCEVFKCKLSDLIQLAETL